MNRKRLADMLFMLLLIINLLSFFYKPGFILYETYSLYANALCLGIVLLVRGSIHGDDLRQLVFIVVFTLYCIFIILVTGGGLGSVFTTLYGFVLLVVIQDFNFNQSRMRVILVMMLALNLYWLSQASGYFIKADGDDITYFNSNTVGMIFMFTSIYIKIMSVHCQYPLRKVWVPLIFIMSVWGIIQVESRMSLIALVAFIFLDSPQVKGIWSKERRTLIIVLVVIITGILIPFVYVLLYRQGIEFSLPFSSKSLYTGREAIWQNFIDTMRTPIQWLLGLGSNAQLWTGHNLNLHNNYLASITNFGLLGTILYYGFYLLQIHKIYLKSMPSKTRNTCISGFVCVLILGFGENPTFYHPLFFLNTLFICIANLEGEPNYEYQENNQSEIPRNTSNLDDSPTEVYSKKVA